MGGDVVGDVLEGVGGEGVVVVQEGDVVAGGHGEGGVGGGGDAAGVVVAGEVDAGVGGGVVLQGGGDGGVGGAVVDEAELPVGVGLGADGGDGFFEHRGGWVVDGGEHRDAGWRRVGGHGDAGGCGGDGLGVGVVQGGFEPERAGDGEGLQGTVGVDAQLQAGAPWGQGAGDGQAAGSAAAVSGADLPGPQLVAGAGGVADGDAGADRAASASPVMGQQHRPRRERHLTPQPHRDGEHAAGVHQQRAPEYPIDVHHPLRAHRPGIQPPSQTGQRQPLARRDAAAHGSGAQPSAERHHRVAEAICARSHRGRCGSWGCSRGRGCGWWPRCGVGARWRGGRWWWGRGRWCAGGRRGR